MHSTMAPQDFLKFDSELPLGASPGERPEASIEIATKAGLPLKIAATIDVVDSPLLGGASRSRNGLDRLAVISSPCHRPTETGRIAGYLIQCCYRARRPCRRPARGFAAV